MRLHEIFNVFFAVVLTLCFLVAGPAVSADPTAEEILNKSFDVRGGEDSISTLTFSFMDTNARERKLSYTMLWKDYKGQDDLVTKMIFFKEFPPADKGIAYMIWMYRPDLNRDDDEWLYLPELRTVRKLSKKIGENGEDSKNDEDSEFSKSVLHRIHLAPRPPGLDTYQLLRSEELDGKEYYVIERTPKNNDDIYPYKKTLNWISKDNFLLTKIDYFDRGGEKIMHQDIKWQKIDAAWIWEKVEAINLNTGNTTVLTISDARVNTGIDDDAFSKRVMKLGIYSLRLTN